MDLFELRDFKAIMRTKIRENKHVKGYQTILAKASGCQRSVISQALNGSLVPTLDQASAMAHHWGFSDEETQYFVDLIQLEKSNSVTLKRLINKRLDASRARRENLADRFSVPALNLSEFQLIYYSSWYWAAIHVAVSIAGLQTVGEIAKRFILPESLVAYVLANLEKMNLVKCQDAQWLPTLKHIHLPKNSALTTINHLNWRHLAINDIERGNDSALHYSSVYAISKADFRTIRSMILHFLDESRLIMQKSTEEELYGFNVDFFTV